MSKSESRHATTRRGILVWPVICGWLWVALATAAAGNELYFVDAHSQVDTGVRSLELVLERMAAGGVARTILAARSGRRPGEVADFADAHPQRIVAAVRTKSGDYNKNRPKYYKKLRQQVESGRFGAMAEVLIYHARKGDKAPEVVVHPGDERVQAALRAAIEKGWPFVLHIEFGALKGRRRQRFMDEMQALLRAHPHHPFALNHIGQLDAAAGRRLLEAHPNLYFLTAHTTPVVVRSSSQPWVNLFAGDRLAPPWHRLITEHPQRFVFALDNVWGEHWQRFYAEQMRCWRQALAQLPAPVAAAVAHGNAERLWKLPARR